MTKKRKPKNDHERIDDLERLVEDLTSALSATDRRVQYLADDIKDLRALIPAKDTDHAR